ncbi:MAG: hypothetical protein AB7L17_15195 [Ilumatobacteraceae bacterium]
MSARARGTAVAAALALVIPVSTSEHASAAATPPADAPAVSLIGDSTMSAMAWYSTSANDIRDIVGSGYDLTFDAESCRRIVIGSCRGRFGYTPTSVLPLMRGALRGKLGEALVLMAGYDDPNLSGSIDQVMAEAAAQGVVRVLWLNYPTGTNYVLPGGLPARTLYDSHNSELVAAAGRHPDLQVLDWNSVSHSQPTWFAGDGIHLTPDGAVGLAHFIRAALDAQPAIGRCRASRALTGDPDVPGQPATLPTTRTGFVPIEPVRVLDTREASLGGENGKLGAGHTVAIDVGRELPHDADAAVLSVTAVDSCAPGFLTVFACGGRPPTSNVNYEIGRTTAGMVITPMTDGDVCVFSSAATDVVVDVMGAFTPDGSRFHPIGPTRWVDTRGTTSTTVLSPEIAGARIAPAETQVMMRGVGGVPADATAVWLNLTVVDPTAATVLSAYPGPCGSAPLSSNVNARSQRSMASSVLVGLGDDGSVCVRTYSGRSDIVIDVAGWFGPGAGGLRYRPVTPERLLDTRSEGGVADAAEHPLSIAGVAVLNVAAVDSSALGFVTVRPCGSPLVSSLVNTTTNEDTANVIAVAGDEAGNTCVRSNIVSHLVVDQVGTFS